jgi:hypothetical protein
MKRILNNIPIAISLVALMLLAGCDDRLFLDPHQSISADQAFETLDDFSYAINGMYAGARSGNLYGGHLNIYPDIMADNLTRSLEGRLSHTALYNWSVSSDYYLMEGVFDQAYLVIYRANKVLEAAEEFEIGDHDEQVEIEHYKGQALAMRALMHFEMVKMFGKAYSQANASDLGIPYMTTSEAGYPSRDALLDVYDLVVQDLEDAYGLIDTEAEVKYQFTRAAIAGLQAKVAMEMGDYPTVISKGKEALAAEPVAARDKFFGIWKDENKDGVLFYIAVEKKDNITLGVNYSQSSSNGIKSEYVCSYELFQLFDSADIRMTSYITTSDFDGNTYNHIEKFRGRSSSVEANPTPDLVDLKVLRAADMALLVAEANMIGPAQNPVEALAYLNLVRFNRYDTDMITFPPLDNIGLLDEIRLQRRLELAFEGDRLFVLKRLGRDIERTADGHYADGSGVGAENLVLEASSFRMQLPLPQSELDVNPNMRDQQNPGY